MYISLAETPTKYFCSLVIHVIRRCEPETHAGNIIDPHDSLKDYHLSPPKKFVVKNIFYRFIKFLSSHVIVFEGVNVFVNIH